MTDASSPTVTDPLDDFVALSVILTGIAKDKLHPPLDTHGTAAEYLAYATQRGGSAFGALMAQYGQLKGEPADAIARAILGPGTPTDHPHAAAASSGLTIAFMARTIMLMWYLGSWYDPDALIAYQDAAHSATPPKFPPPSVVISMDAYTQGWAWRVAQAHPMGYSDLRFGYWNAAPPPLEDFVGAGT